MKQKIVTLMMLMLFTVVSILATGCAEPGLTRKDVHRRHINAFQNDLWLMQEDLDAFLLMDRPSRLSPMMVR